MEHNMNPDFEIKPFTRIVWRTQEDKDEWNDKLGRISMLYNNTEYETLKLGIRRACTMHIDMTNLKTIISKLNNDGLIFTPIAQSAYYEGFSHKHITPQPGQPSYWYGCVTRNLDDANTFLTASNAQDKGQESIHLPIGELLGFPPCCSETFTKLWTTGNYDPMFEIAKNTKGMELVETDDAITCKVNIGNNQLQSNSLQSPLLRYFGIRTISHFPCSLDCKESERVAKKWIDVMNNIDGEATEWLKEILCSIQKWDSRNGVVEVHTPYFLGLTHTYPYLGKRRVIELKEN